MITSTLIIITTIAVGIILFMPKVATNTLWRATVTPLASIIGSGFLILGPILDRAYEGYAPLVMAALCGVAFVFGKAIRANIRSRETPLKDALISRFEDLSSWVLAFAYIISVAYYLNLFGAFGVRLTSFDSTLNAKILTTSVFLLILIVGWTRGFSALERLEQISVSLKLAIIAGLIIGLAIYFGQRTLDGHLEFKPVLEPGWAALTLAFGLIVTIQGFETSRYLGDEYDAETRIRSMRFAQYISSAIYITYIILIAYVFHSEKFGTSETAIIDMMSVVAPVLPALLVVAALSAQFSAAVADTEGSGGLVVELTRGRIKTHSAYALLVAAGLVLTWTSNIFEIVAYASRAFALYYAVQASIAAFYAAKAGKPVSHRLAYGILALLGLVITIFGTPVES